MWIPSWIVVPFGILCLISMAYEAVKSWKSGDKVWFWIIVAFGVSAFCLGWFSGG